jgi:hypothetical protein
MLYAVGDRLRVVGFDGTQFTGPLTELELISPDWTAMSYDVAAGQMYYSTGDRLRVVGFDGTQFTGPLTELELLSPAWAGMSLLYSAGPPAGIPEPVTLTLTVSGIAASMCAARRRNRPWRAQKRNTP